MYLLDMCMSSLSGFTDIRSTMKTPDISKGLPSEFSILFDLQFQLYQTLRNFKCLQLKMKVQAAIRFELVTPGTQVGTAKHYTIRDCWKQG